MSFRNPLLLGYDLGYNVIGPALTGGKKKNGKLNKQVRPVIKSTGKKELSPENVAMGMGMMDGEGLYAQRNINGRGHLRNTARGRNKRGTMSRPKLERFPNVIQVPPSFEGGALQRNTQHRTATDIGVGGTLLSNFEQHPAMRSQPYMSHFHKATHLPPQFQKFHKMSV
jgi:hypothetical protein